MVVPVHYTMAAKLCGKKNLTVTDMTSMSALLKTTAPDTIEFNNIHGYEEIPFCHWTGVSPTEKYATRMTSRPPMTKSKFPSSERLLQYSNISVHKD